MQKPSRRPLTAGFGLRKTLPTLIPLSLVLAVSCAPATQKIYTVDEVRAQVLQRAEASVVDKIIVPFEIDEEIRQLARSATKDMISNDDKTRALVDAIISRTGMSISYDWLSNKTARQVFREGRGNCLAYTNLFIGMAREVGLDAVYVDVTTIERVSKEAEVIVNNGHITAGIPDGPEVTMIDFTSTPEREYQGAKILDDFEAIANYYNNQGFLYGYFAERADAMEAGVDPLEAELLMYETALDVVPNFPRARNNLGVALKRRGRVDEAIEQYKLALEADAKFSEARSNLGSAYYSQGRVEDAIAEFERAAKNSGSNGYFYHHLGVIQLQQGNLDEAAKQFKKALSKESKLSDARFFLGEVYLRQGKEKDAIREYQKTLENDPNYLSARTKLELLGAPLPKKLATTAEEAETISADPIVRRPPRRR